eukprot:1343879-Karenia_brevis.AAC.1
MSMILMTPPSRPGVSLSAASSKQNPAASSKPRHAASKRQAASRGKRQAKQYYERLAATEMELRE